MEPIGRERRRIVAKQLDQGSRQFAGIGMFGRKIIGLSLVSARPPGHDGGRKERKERCRTPTVPPTKQAAPTRRTSAAPTRSAVDAHDAGENDRAHGPAPLR